MPNPLHFSPEFNERTPDKQIDYLKKLAAAQNEALDLMQKERDALRDEGIIKDVMLRNAQIAVDTQKGVVMNLVTKSNSDGQDVAARILELETRIKEQDLVIEGLNGGKH